MRSIITLALWRLRKTWFLLFVNTLGMITAVIIICAIPLFSDVMTTAGLRNVLNEVPTDAEMRVNTQIAGLSTPLVRSVYNQLDAPIRQNIGSLAQQTQFTITSSDFSFLRPPKSGSSLTVSGITMTQAASHFGQLQGRTTHITNSPLSDIEVMLTPETAKQIGVNPGSTFKVQLSYFTHALKPDTNNVVNVSNPRTLSINAHVVGIFTVDNSAYWHGENFKPYIFPSVPKTYYFYPLLVSNEALLNLADALSKTAHSDGIYTASPDTGYGLFWDYRLNTVRIFNSDLDTLIAHLNNSQVTYLNLYTGTSTASTYPYITTAQLSGSMFGTAEAPGNLDSFRSRTAVARIPVLVLTLQIVALILFFISLITNLLVDSQADTIALLRSRGASTLQIFGALLMQSLVLGVLAVLFGVPLAIVAVFTFTKRLLPLAEQDALNVISNSLLQTVLHIIWYAIIIALVAVITMSFTLFFAARADILTLRRESARTNKRPFWQRLNLDLITGIVALAGYGFSLYLTSIGSGLEGDAQTLIATPLSVLAPFFLILGCILLFLRLFPLLLRFGAFIASRGRGAIFLLAIVQIARSPRQSVRMIMLLTFAVAFALFTLVFNATQAQHIRDVSTYLTGADFSGSIPVNSESSTSKVTAPSQELQQYQTIPGVLATSIGYSTRANGGNTNLPLEVRAIDTATFANAVIWSSEAEYQSAKTLLTRLQQAQFQAITTKVVPVVVDTNVIDSLQLHVGSSLVVKEDAQAVHDIHCTIIGVVPHIPTVNDRVATDSTSGNRLLVTGGVLLDYASYVSVYAQQAKGSSFGQTAPKPNLVWIRSKDDATSLTSVRSALNYPSTLALDKLSDRRALLSSLNNDPLYVDIGGVLALGTITALVLAFLGDLLASWLSARTRLTTFAVLRALGTTSQQVTSLLTWEQAIIYITGLLLGTVFGITFALSVIPSLTFTDLSQTTSSNAFYNLQTSLPTQVVLPATLPFALLILVLIFVIALVVMVRVISQPLLSQSLRLNED